MKSSDGRTELPTQDPASLIYLIRSAANTKYPELKNWRFQLKDNKIICIPKFSYLDTEFQVKELNEYLDYTGIIELLMSLTDLEVLLTNVAIVQREFALLVSFALTKNYDILKEDNNIRVIKHGTNKG